MHLYKSACALAVEVHVYLLVNHVEGLEHGFRFLVLDVVFLAHLLHHGHDHPEVLARHIREEAAAERTGA